MILAAHPKKIQTGADRAERDMHFDEAGVTPFGGRRGDASEKYGKAVRLPAKEQSGS